MTDDASEVIVALLAREVPQIPAGVVRIMAIARRPGVRTKIAVWCPDASVDPVAVIVGPRGARMRKVIEATNGELFDLVRWDANPERLIANALRPIDLRDLRLVADRRIAYAVRRTPLRGAAPSDADTVCRELAERLTGWRILLVDDLSTL